MKALANDNINSDKIVGDVTGAAASAFGIFDGAKKQVEKEV